MDGISSGLLPAMEALKWAPSGGADADNGRARARLAAGGAGTGGHGFRRPL